MYRLIAILLALICIGTATFFPYSKDDVLVNALKYSHLNIPQNEGLHRFALSKVKQIASALYRPTIYPKVIDLTGIGSSVKQPMYLTDSPFHIKVANTEQLFAAIKAAEPGEHIVLQPGIYVINQPQVPILTNGEKGAPITISAVQLGEVRLLMSGQEGFAVKARYWKFENLIFVGAKGHDGAIEHAIHLSGDADFVEISNNQFINFNAHIKSNGAPNSRGELDFPDGLLIANNDIYNQWKRNTKSPASPIDIVGGDSVIVKNNFIADFGKYGRQGYGTTYGAFMKGGGINGLFDNNIVMCEWRLPHTSPLDIRVGLSFGNGGTGSQFCADGKCEYEHVNGTMRNNTILNCVNDVGIYLNKAKNTLVENNAVRSSLGVDIRFEQSSADIVGNIIEGRVNQRNGASASLSDNIFE
ncbi:hypothetical protein DXX93_00725 [Thalassotalea euphylliae]|uniref:Right handed beta helix domain-containing protein n=1 Tax=Thalassotalea euphylliae TaxID=1655234 RepID=A0A3E0TKZ9_9GAMM|nr:right-handed parallel beta-helix repeat-containing protein [Thalassotalea euphylliae]REL25224.1 hypothetical protein DXX93_00725 [Thalassotalea euphylliae]